MISLNFIWICWACIKLQRKHDCKSLPESLPFLVDKNFLIDFTTDS